MGLREENQGTSEFDPLWELEDGTNGTDSSDAVDATASGGGKVTCTFTTEAGLDERVSINTNQAHSGTTNWHHFFGRYLVLLRAKVGSSTECGVQLTIGGPSDSEYGAKCEEVYIDNTGWKLIELGQVTFPPSGFRENIGGNLTGKYTTFFLHAERLSGSGSLDMDCLYLIPCDHHIHAYGYVDDEMFLESYTLATDEQQFLMRPVGTSEYTSSYEMSWKDWYLPTNVAFGVIAGQTLTAHSLSETFTWTLQKWFPRWRLFRDV